MRRLYLQWNNALCLNFNRLFCTNFDFFSEVKILFYSASLLHEDAINDKNNSYEMIVVCHTFSISSMIIIIIKYFTFFIQNNCASMLSNDWYGLLRHESAEKMWINIKNFMIGPLIFLEGARVSFNTSRQRKFFSIELCFLVFFLKTGK